MKLLYIPFLQNSNRSKKQFFFCRFKKIEALRGLYKLR